MKTIWKKTPVWLKAIILLIITFYPISIAVEVPIAINKQFYPTWGWALLSAFPLWILFWFLVKKWDPFKKEGDIKLELKFDIRNKKNWFRIIAMICLTYALVQLFLIAFNVETSKQLDMIRQFKLLEPAVAVPLLLTIAIHAGFVEELVYRGFVQNTLNRAYGVWVAFIGVGILFAVSHMLPLPLLLPYVLISLGFSLIAHEMKSTGVGIWAHIIFDFLIFLVIYYDAIDIMSSQALYYGLVALILGLFFLFRDNKVLKFKVTGNEKLSEVN